MRFLGYLLSIIGICIGSDYIIDIYIPHLGANLLAILEYAVSGLLIFNSFLFLICLRRLKKNTVKRTSGGGMKLDNLGNDGPLSGQLHGSSGLDREWQRRT